MNPTRSLAEAYAHYTDYSKEYWTLDAEWAGKKKPTPVYERQVQLMLFLNEVRVELAELLPVEYVVVKCLFPHPEDTASKAEMAAALRELSTLVRFDMLSSLMTNKETVYVVTEVTYDWHRFERVLSIHSTEKDALSAASGHVGSHKSRARSMTQDEKVSRGWDVPEEDHILIREMSVDATNGSQSGEVQEETPEKHSRSRPSAKHEDGDTK